jgi:hypothetical protein
MRIPRSRVKELLADAPSFGSNPRRHSISRMADALRIKNRRTISRYMQPWMLLLDEAVQFLIHFERFQYSRQLTSKTSPFAMQISQMRSTVLSLRELVVLGQDAPAHALGRVLIDEIELAMAIAISPKFAIGYSSAKEPTEFWKIHIAYGKIYPYVERFVKRGGGSSLEVADYVAHHKAVKNYLSDHVHVAYSSALRTAVPPSLIAPGRFHFKSIGAINAHLPSLCLFVAREIHMFSGCCVKLFIGPKPPPALAGYTPTGLLGDAVSSSHILQELVVEYEDQLEAEQSRLAGPGR